MASNYHIGIDLGGTKIEVAVLDSQDKIIFRERLLTEAHLGSDHIFDQIQTLYGKAVISIQNKTHSLGLGTPGSISKNTHLLKNSNTLCLNSLPLQALLEDKLVHDIIIENDANCFAIAEALMGAGKGYLASSWEQVAVVELYLMEKLDRAHKILRVNGVIWSLTHKVSLAIAVQMDV
jgi:fructokinase